MAFISSANNPRRGGEICSRIKQDISRLTTRHKSSRRCAENRDSPGRFGILLEIGKLEYLSVRRIRGTREKCVTFLPKNYLLLITNEYL